MPLPGTTRPSTTIIGAPGGMPRSWRTRATPSGAPTARCVATPVQPVEPSDPVLRDGHPQRFDHGHQATGPLEAAEAKREPRRIKGPGQRDDLAFGTGRREHVQEAQQADRLADSGDRGARRPARGLNAHTARATAGGRTSHVAPGGSGRPPNVTPTPRPAP